eukprot:6194676-Pleurochrysis_carterae.AAC.2
MSSRPRLGVTLAQTREGCARRSRSTVSPPEEQSVKYRINVCWDVRPSRSERRRSTCGGSPPPASL